MTDDGRLEAVAAAPGWVSIRINQPSKLLAVLPGK
jgi:hypothetical protein